MKYLKKLGSVLLALVMVLALMAPALAYDTATNEPEITVKEHDFYAFQLFTGEPVSPGSKYFKNTDASPLSWGQDLSTPGLQKAFVDALISVCQMDAHKAVLDPDGDTNSVRAQLAVLSSDNRLSSKAGDVADLLALMYDEVNSDRSRDISDAIWDVFVKAFPNTMADYEIKAGAKKASPEGYYLLHDKAEAVTGQANILLVHTASAGTTVTPKTTPDNNDLTKQVVSAEIPGSWSHATTYQIGDKVPFRIIAPIPGSFATDNTTTGNGFEMNFVDKPSAGLLMSTNKDQYALNVYRLKTATDTDKTTALTYNGKEYYAVDKPTGTSEWPFTFTTMVEPTAQGGGEFHFDITNMKAESSAYLDCELGDLIVIEYEAEFVGVRNADGTLNKEYSNNVSLKYTGHDDEITDKDNLYTFELDINKTDGASKQKLPGAKFSLYMETTADDEDLESDLKHPVTGEALTGNWKLVKTIDGKGDGDELGESTFKFDNLKAGNYMLIEDEAPAKDPDGNNAKYNKIPPKYYVIEATYTAEAKQGAQVLQSVRLYETGSDFNTAGLEPISTTSSGDSSLAAGSVVDNTVENNQGTLLPETGGIGTTIFYIVGGVLVVGAVVLLITKRRAGADEE